MSTDPRAWLIESQEITEFYKKLIESDQYSKVELQSSDNSASMEFDPSRPLLNQSPGKIAFRPDSSDYKYSQDLQSINENTELSKSKGFFRDIATRSADHVYTGFNVRLCVAHERARTCFDEDLFYQKSRSGALARRVSQNVIRQASDVMPKAYILPFPYRVDKYYHSFAEMGFGLRHLDKVPEHTPIVYDEDRFKILPFFCETLGVDKSRLVKATSIEGCSISKAVMPDSPAFYWDAGVVSFFQDLGSRFSRQNKGTKQGPSKIYISRSKASRRPLGEERLEQKLKEIGFEIIHAEHLTIAQQVGLFSGARQIVATHGAGLTNLVFCKPNFHLFEIFNPNYITPNFFHRLKPLDLTYNYVIADSEGKYIDHVCSLVDDHRI